MLVCNIVQYIKKKYFLYTTLLHETKLLPITLLRNPNSLLVLFFNYVITQATNLAEYYPVDTPFSQKWTWCVGATILKTSVQLFFFDSLISTLPYNLTKPFKK